MEEKKSRKADLERGWIPRFVLGLVIALTCFLIALFMPFPEDDPLDDPDLLEMFSMDEELSSLMRPENELALAPKVEPEPAKKLVVKDEEELETEPLKDDEPVETDMNSDMSAMDDEIEIDVKNMKGMTGLLSSKRFVQCSRADYVNMDFIRRVGSRTVELQGKFGEVTLSEERRQDVISRLDKRAEEKGRFTL